MKNEILKELSKLKLRYWLKEVLIDWLWIISGMLVIRWVMTSSLPAFSSIIIFVASMIVIGCRQHALAIMGHEGAHRLASRNRFVNDLLTGLFCFWPLGFPINGYRKFHFKHHKTVGTTNDPEMIHKHNSWLGQWRLPFRTSEVAVQVIGDLFGGGIPHLCFAAYLTKAVSVADQLEPVLMIFIFVSVCWYLGHLWIPLVWFGSMIIVFWIIFRFRIWTEHTVNHGDPTHRISATYWQRFLLLPHNTWCHWEHHLYPQVPEYNLSILRNLIGGDVITLEQLFGKLRNDLSRNHQ